jgi:hypothetical protein
LQSSGAPFINTLQEKDMSTIHEQIIAEYENYLKESESFDTKNVKAAAARARKALGNMGKLAKSRRAEIQEKKNAL